MNAAAADPAWIGPRLRARLTERTWVPVAEPGELRAAAVLIPLVVRDGRVGVVFTERAAGLRDHSGQVSFPGGKRDPEDRSATVTALREADEELGLQPASVEILGRIDEQITITNFRVTPVVGLVAAPPTSWRPSPEVAEVFEVDLLHLADPTVFALVTMRGHEVHTYRPGPRYIWGVTGRIVSSFLDVVRGLS